MGKQLPRFEDYLEAAYAKFHESWEAAPPPQAAGLSDAQKQTLALYLPEIFQAIYAAASPFATAQGKAALPALRADITNGMWVDGIARTLPEATKLFDAIANRAQHLFREEILGQDASENRPDRPLPALIKQVERQGEKAALFPALARQALGDRSLQMYPKRLRVAGDFLAARVGWGSDGALLDRINDVLENDRFPHRRPSPLNNDQKHNLDIFIANCRGAYNGLLVLALEHMQNTMRTALAEALINQPSPRKPWSAEYVRTILHEVQQSFGAEQAHLNAVLPEYAQRLANYFGKLAPGRELHPKICREFMRCSDAIYENAADLLYSYVEPKPFAHRLREDREQGRPDASRGI